jgi:4-aminobutyrate aminotransferase-like enzyme
MRLLKTTPKIDKTFIRSKGAYLYDEDERPYLDLLSGVWCAILGHSHPRFISALKEQMDKLIHMNIRYQSHEIESANEALASILPSNLDRTTWLNTGSEAVELSLKIALKASGQGPIVTWDKGYLGATNYVYSLTHDGYVHHDDVVRVPAPTCNHCSLGYSHPECDMLCINQALESLGNAAVFVYEPVMASGGVIVPPSGYNSRVQEWADNLGALLISEEVTTGIGRTGKWFGFQHENMHPDILVLGKALGNGLPVAAVITTSDVERSCAGELYHYQSHQNDPWSGAVAKTVIEIMIQEDIVTHCKELGHWFLNQLKQIVDNYSVAVHARGLGLMIALELTNAKYCSELESHLFNQKILTDYRDYCQCFRFFPPYIINRDQLSQVVSTIENWLGTLDT